MHLIIHLRLYIVHYTRNACKRNFLLLINAAKLIRRTSKQLQSIQSSEKSKVLPISFSKLLKCHSQKYQYILPDFVTPQHERRWVHEVHVHVHVAAERGNDDVEAPPQTASAHARDLLQQPDNNFRYRYLR